MREGSVKPYEKNHTDAIGGGVILTHILDLTHTVALYSIISHNCLTINTPPHPKNLFQVRIRYFDISSMINPLVKICAFV